jgi:hypothetical protein
VVEFYPERVGIPEGCPPGYLRWDDRLVYREYSQITKPSGIAPGLNEPPAGLVGTRFGTAWVPAQGGRQAKGSNPYEKVETAARGRHLGAWGFGVLPGSGIASLDEVMGAPANREALDADEPADTAKAKAPNKGELITECLELWERLRQLRNEDDAVKWKAIAEYCQKNYRVDVVTELIADGTPIVDLSRLKAGVLAMMANTLRGWISKATEL